MAEKGSSGAGAVMALNGSSKRGERKASKKIGRRQPKMKARNGGVWQ
jgi:hypothetical protein